MMENTLAFHPDEGEVPIEMIEQGINTGGIDYYPLTPESPENKQSYYTPPVCSPYHATKGNNKGEYSLISIVCWYLYKHPCILLTQTIRVCMFWCVTVDNRPHWLFIKFPFAQAND